MLTRWAYIETWSGREAYARMEAYTHNVFFMIAPALHIRINMLSNELVSP